MWTLILALAEKLILLSNVMQAIDWIVNWWKKRKIAKVIQKAK